MKLAVFCFLYFLCARSAFADDNSTDSAEKVFDFVNKARASLRLTTNPNIILVTGITGTGKSTLSHYVTGNYSKMIAIEPTGVGAEYTIYDGLDPDVDNQDSSTVSRTFIPEMNVDEEQNVLYDCPGFADTRNETVEIATTFLIKSVIENAKSIKIILVVNFEAVTKGHDRQDFDNSLSRLSELVQNVTRFENSLSIVITKVPSYYISGEQIVEVLENSIVNATAQFINEHRTFLQQKEPNRQKVQIIDALLKQSPNGNYPRISVFWRPMKAGPFDKIPKMVDGRRSIRESMLNSTAYTNFEQNDFGFPLSAETKLKITSIAQDTINQISSTLNNVDTQLLSAIQQKIQSIEDFQSKLDLLTLGMKSIESSGGKEPTTLKEWTDQLKAVISTFTIASIDMNEFNRVEQHENNLKILQSIAGTEIAAPIRDLIAKSSSAIKYQSTEHTWYTFLVHVFTFFTNYEVQKDVTAYNVANLADWGQISKPQGLIITAANYVEFTTRFPGVSTAGITVTEPRLKEINDIIAITLTSPVQYECNGDTMNIKGNIGKSSDIQPPKCPQPLKKINMYIMSTFYVDGDLTLSGIDELRIYAPKWSIERATIFNLNGINGVVQPALTTPGTPGKPGDVGTNGANFFGFANELLNGELLTVSSNGGTGANGQTGTGNADVTVEFAYFEDHDSTHGSFGDAHARAVQRLRERNYDLEDLGGENYRLHARCCGVTGKGGQGGLGGQPGFYVFISAVTDAAHKPKSITNAGPNGPNGPDAAVCKTNAAEVHVDWSDKKKDWGTRRVRDWHFRFVQHVSEPRCPDNIVGSTEPIPPQKPRLPLDVASGIIAYKSILVENMNNFAFKSIIKKVYEAIESNPEIKQAFSVNAYAEEANALEKQFFRMNQQIDMFPLYQNLLNRIEGYSVTSEASLPEVDRRILRLLYTTIFGKASSIRSGHKTDLIIDVEGFLDSTLANIVKLDDIGRARVISSIRDRYKDEISDKIKEALNYVDNDIQPEIAKIFENLDLEMHKTVNETIDLQEKTIKEIQRKQELAKKLRKKSGLQKIVGVVKSVAGVVSSFVSYANTVANVISTVAGFVGEKVPEIDTQNSFIFQMRKINENEIEAMEKELNKLKSSINNTNGSAEEVAEISKKMTEFAAKIASVKANPTHSETRNVLGQMLEFVNKPLGALKNVTDKTTEFLKPFEKASNILSVVASSISTYKQFTDNDAKLDEIGRAINQDRETLRNLMAFEDQIYDKLIPLLGATQGNLKNITSNISNKTLVALDVQKWKLAPTLREIQKLFTDMLHGFGTEYQVGNYLQRVEESMNLIINIYARIQNYQEQTRFVVYVSDLQAADYRNLNVTDAHLQDNINNLRFNLHANILIAQYYRAVDAFKQAVFPFAAGYLDIYELPKSLEPTKDDNMDSIIAPISDNIKSLSGSIKELNKTVINHDDMSIYNAYFDRNGDANGPFHVWPKDKIRDKVGQLFAGQKIYLMADVAENTDFNAVKFRTITVDFRSDNQTTNDRLIEILQSFHVSLTHLGESNYRCDNEFYTIHSRPLTLEFSFATRRQMPTVRNVAYDKLNAANPILSPYTMWAIQLSHGQFDQLKEFAEIVDIELHGYGQFVKRNANICNSNLEKYYQIQNAH